MLVISNHNSFRVLSIKLLPYILFEKYSYILALEMASPGNQHCANCIGTLSIPTAGHAMRQPLTASKSGGTHGANQLFEISCAYNVQSNLNDLLIDWLIEGVDRRQLLHERAPPLHREVLRRPGPGAAGRRCRQWTAAARSRLRRPRSRRCRLDRETAGRSRRTHGRHQLPSHVHQLADLNATYAQFTPADRPDPTR